MADKTVNKTELVAEIAGATDLSQAEVSRVIDAFFSSLAAHAAKGVKVSIPGWMAVEQTQRAARTGRNPQTGEAIQIAASKGVKITAGSKLKAAVK
ncbi:DNA-binding protein HU [Pseudoclavibacter triregionum]|nr:DNA-binding protein HU [Pseudoclavibacter triregionum]